MNLLKNRQTRSIKKSGGIASRLFAFCLLLLLFAIPANAAEITKSEDDSFTNVAVANVSGGRLNVRSSASTSGSIVGYMTNHSAAIIKKTVTGDGGKWYYITSGSVTGYVKASYMETGAAAKALAKKYGTASYVVDVTTLKLRASASASSSVLVKLSEGTGLKVISSGISGGSLTWAKVRVTVSGKTYTGYVAEKYISKAYTLSTATAKSGTSTTASTTSATSSGSTGARIVSLAKSYVGKVRYVYGGTSLTSGIDCSGFTQAIYRACGITIPRTSRQQAASGKSISKSSLQVGDLVFYKNGSSTISHVAIYIGNGQIVHAANTKKGICISNMTYMTPCKYVTYTH